MQAVCDNEMRILDVFIGFPGSVHDSRVFRNSPLAQNLEEKCGRYFILGDSGYPLTTKLLTPFKDRGNLTREQLNYNLKLSKNRYVIEHCFGMLKQRFRQLFHIKLRKIVYIVHLIRAACVLHNFCIDNDIQIEDQAMPAIPADLLMNEIDDEQMEENNDRDARRIRDNIVNNLIF